MRLRGQQFVCVLSLLRRLAGIRTRATIHMGWNTMIFESSVQTVECKYPAKALHCPPSSAAVHEADSRRFVRAAGIPDLLVSCFPAISTVCPPGIRDWD